MKIIYSSHPEKNQIKVWKTNFLNEVKLIQKIDMLNSVQPMFINYKQKVLYAGVKSEAKIITFKIDVNGMLKKLSEIQLHGNPSYICTDLYYKYLYTASYSKSSFSISRIKKDGSPELPHQIIKNIKGCHSVNIDLNNEKIFLPALLEDCIYICNLQNNGFINFSYSKKINSAKNSGPRHMTFNPDKIHFYSINELNSTVDVWKINSNIKKIQTLEILPKKIKNNKWASDIHVSPNGKYLYTCDRSANIITTIKIKKTGYLDIIEYKETEHQPREFVIDNNGKYLIVAGQKSNYIRIYKINLNGKIDTLFRYNTGINPTWILIY